MEVLTELHGRLCGLTRFYNLVSNSFRMTPEAVDASITLGPLNGVSANVRSVSIQLKNSDGTPIPVHQDVEVRTVLETVLNTPATTGGTTGFATTSANPGILTIIAKKLFNVTSTTTGLISGTFGDTASEACYLAVRLPTGRWVYSAILNA